MPAHLKHQRARELRAESPTATPFQNAGYPMADGRVDGVALGEGYLGDGYEGGYEGEVYEGEGPWLDGDPGCGAACGTACGPACGPACGLSPHPSCYYGRAEVLLWWTDGISIPALATTNPNNGVLPTATVVFGNDRINDQMRAGGRYTLGKWLCCGDAAVEATYLGLGNATTAFRGDGTQFNFLARPFFNADPNVNTQDSRPIEQQNVITGQLDILATTRFQSLELQYRRALGWEGCVSIDYYFGYRFAQLEDTLRIEESTIGLQPPFNVRAELFDQFTTRSNFHGGQFATRVHWQNSPCWSLEMRAKLAIGGTHLKTAIRGETVSGGVTQNQGLLAQPSNINEYGQSRFGALSEFGVTWQRSFVCGLTGRVGYDFLYWSDVVRAGDQIDLGVNETQLNGGQLVGEARPAFSQRTQDFWAQGIHLGLEYQY